MKSDALKERLPLVNRPGNSYYQSPSCPRENFNWVSHQSLPVLECVYITLLETRVDSRLVICRPRYVWFERSPECGSRVPHFLISQENNRQLNLHLDLKTLDP